MRVESVVLEFWLEQGNIELPSDAGVSVVKSEIFVYPNMNG